MSSDPCSAWTTGCRCSAGVSEQEYRMVGIPDGLGAHPNSDGTSTLFMNHELGFSADVGAGRGRDLPTAERSSPSGSSTRMATRLRAGEPVTGSWPGNTLPRTRAGRGRRGADAAPVRTVLLRVLSRALRAGVRPPDLPDERGVPAGCCVTASTARVAQSVAIVDGALHTPAEARQVQQGEHRGADCPARAPER